ncbi:hypothetical protein HanIR_Chr17g0895321 [Helianthus annuus]|nr:hypothetical protein HanIR_Chr17g0895321 [Helianthus annuus]
MGFPGLGMGLKEWDCTYTVTRLSTIVLGCEGYIRKTYVYLYSSLSSGCEGHLRKTYVNLYSLLPRIVTGTYVKPT